MRALIAILLLLSGGAYAQPSGCPFNMSTCPSKATGSTTARTQAARAADVTNVLDFGADNTGVTHTAAAIQAAIVVAAAKPTGGEVFLPAGTYYINTSTSHITPLSNVTIRGAGMGKTTIICDDTNTSPAYCIYNGQTPISNLTIRDLTVQGKAATTTTASTSQMIGLVTVTDLLIDGVESKYSRMMGMWISQSNRVIVRNSRIYRTIMDGIAVWDSSAVTITGNTIEGANDDAISAHTTNSLAAPERSGLVITNNNITESQGITAYGIKIATISNNVMRRIMAYGIFWQAGSGFGQGDTPTFAVSITGNTITDVFKRPETSPRNSFQAYIQVTGAQKQVGTGSAVPGYPVPVSGFVVPLYGTTTGNFYAQGTNTSTVPTAGGGWFNISGNVLMRSLPAATAWANWGYGSSLWTGDNNGGVAFTGAVPEVNLTTNGIKIDGAVQHTRISNNILNTTGALSIYFASAIPASLDYDDVVISENQITDFSNSAIFFNSASPDVQRIVIRGNEISGDPRFLSTNRGAAGTWATFAAPYGIYAPNTSGLTIENNGFRNVAVATNLATVEYVRGNRLYCQPVATGFSTSNKGIGQVSQSGEEYVYLIEDSDPTSTTFGRLLQTTKLSTSTQPASGVWVFGMFVKNNGPTVSAGKVLLGWLRLTTGSGNVDGTDWTPVYGTTS